jgi:hypothetical protein
MKRIAAVLAYTLLVTQFTYAAQPVQPPSPQQTSTTSEAAAQSRLLSAKNIYIADDGADEHFPGSPVEAEHAFAASLRAWGRYNIVSSAQEADIVLQVRGGVNRSYVPASDDSYGSYVYRAYFRLTIADPANLDPLWVITVPVLTGNRKKDNVDLFNTSAANLTSQLKLLTDTPLTPRETADLREPIVRLHRRNALAVGLLVGFVAVGVGGGLLLHHEFENSVADQKKTADAWCIANHFPLSECAGG